MNTPISWIKALVPELNPTDKEYMDKMTLFGTKVESYEPLDAKLDKIVVGQVLSISPHPDADKLIICQLDVGAHNNNQPLQIVTGAHNFKEGDKVPVVLDGGRVASSHGSTDENGVKIKKGKLRGVESFGMLCSIEELGSSRHFYPEAPEDGIYVFQEDVAVGSDAVELLGLHDTSFEYEITSNRVDCFGVIGIAREAAAAFRLPFSEPEIKSTGNSEDISKEIKLKVENKELCQRFALRLVKNLKIEPSPKWLQRRLSNIGIRPINNIVDITNYVMKEYGQPMHAYDIDTIANKTIIVKNAEQGQSFTTLDDIERKLDSDTLMIWDAEKPIGIAGIMGGQNSMITDNAKTLLLECANFDGTNIRLTSKRLGLRTEASALFEKGLPPENVEKAINRACELIEELGAGKVVGGIYEESSYISEPVLLPLQCDAMNKLLGTSYSKEEFIKCFKDLGISYDESSNKLNIPYFRTDLRLMADLAEEAARYYGYDNIPTTLPKGATTIGGISKKSRLERTAVDIARAYGFSESMSYSFESGKVFDKLRLDEKHYLRYAIEIMNPLGEDFKIMRTSGLNGLLCSLSTNYNHRNKDVRLFELATSYRPKELPLKELPDEHVFLTLGFYGKGDFFDMKAVVEDIINTLKIKGDLRFENNKDIPYLHTGRQASITIDNKFIGVIGELHPEVVNSYSLAERTYIASLDLKIIESMEANEILYRSIPKFPASSRDLSLIANKTTTAREIQDIITKKAGKTLESLELIDIYEGLKEANKKSLTYSLTFRAGDRTLSDEEVNSSVNKVLKGLEEIDVVLRS